MCGALLSSAASAGMYFFYANTSHKPLVWQLSLIGITWCCSALFARQFILQLTQGDIDFDGVNWYFGEKTGKLRVLLDGQNYMLVRFEDDFKNVNWFWLEPLSNANQEVNRWHDLRRAVYSRPDLQNSPTLL